MKRAKRALCQACLRPLPFRTHRRTCSPECERRLRALEVGEVGRVRIATPAPAPVVPALDDWAGIGEAENPCYYCGSPADTIDHVVPRSLLVSITDSGVDELTAAAMKRSRRMTVPACRECNGLAGAKFHETLAERAEFVRTRLGQRYRKALAMPDWSATELAELAPGLRGYVIAGLIERDLLRRRLRYRAKGLTPIAPSVRELVS